MTKNKAFLHFLQITLLITSVFCSFSSFAQEDAEETKKNIPTFKMNGEVALLTNYVEKGLTQTESDPALQAAFSFNFGPQFKMGLWGSNVNFDSTEHFLLKINAELKVVISSTTDFKLGYYDNRYFKTDSRNGNTTYLHIMSHGYKIMYEADSNWEGTDDRATYYAFGKTFELNQNWQWDNQIGYSMLNAEGMNDYFDLRTGFLYKGSSNILYQMMVTATSAPSQFNGHGGAFIILGASTTF